MKLWFPIVAAIPAFTFCLGAYGAKKAPAPAPPSLGEQMLGHVEKVLIVDSLTVDRYEFFRNYRMQPSAGRILAGADVKEALGGRSSISPLEGEPFTGFTNEFNDYMIWAQADTTGYLRLVESVRLGDGSWSSPEVAPAVLNAGEETDEDEPVEANAAFPFMLDDGQTLYFASDNAQSLGGYDIFIATKDPSDNEFLIPGNLGMPFNSEYDDYMMALDRQTGVGWWATDRNRLEDMITIYIYALSDERVNVDPDDENLMSYATLSGWESILDTEQEAERQRLRAELSRIRPRENRTPEIELPMPGGRTYLYLSDFSSKKAASQMQLYLGQKASFEKKEKELLALRSRFAGGDKSVATKIATLEKQLREEESSLRSLLSEIYRLETSK